MIDRIIKALNDRTILQTSSELSEDLDVIGYHFLFTICQAELVERGLGIEKHRHCEYGVDVYKCNYLGEDFILGVTKVHDFYSEMGSWSDFSHTYEFFEMEEVTTITYKAKGE